MWGLVFGSLPPQRISQGRFGRPLFVQNKGIESLVKLHPKVQLPQLIQYLEQERMLRKEGLNREGLRLNKDAMHSLKEIPACFKVDRWTKLAAKKPIFELDTIVSTSCAQMGQQNRMIYDAWSRLYKCMDLTGRDIDKLQYVINAAESIQQKLEEVVGGGSISNASTDLQTYFGCTVPDIIEIQPPLVSVTKGRAKRIKTGVEKAIEQQTHAQIRHYCKQVTSHDSRNCLEKRN
ncbi:hypothetical protein Cgig2_029716 [Carnegiea gigantea]|uniref:Uncharacterized protein n=1 Tax=Carnegiea gigantea TaxID=171969 RepID=A0A9Q1GQF0_9CARY|nr:hypothetical protein Cgig2_029716 [Carnegiea gigantea]